MTLLLPAGLRTELIRLAEVECPFECCGLLAGQCVRESIIVEAVHPVVNELKSPVAFRTDASSMFAAIRSIENHGRQWLGVYHSHPTSAPIPSRTDKCDPAQAEMISLLLGRENHDWAIQAYDPKTSWQVIPIREM